MASFDPKIPFVESTNFISRSKGQIADKSLGAALAGAGKVVEGVAADMNQHEERSIERDLFAAEEAQREAYEPGLQAALSEAETLGEKNRQFAIDPVDYETQMLAKVRGLKQQYPHRKGFIDRKVASIHGGDPANRLLSERVRAFRKAEAAATSAANRQANFFKENADLIGMDPYRLSLWEDPTKHDELERALVVELGKQGQYDADVREAWRADRAKEQNEKAVAARTARELNRKTSNYIASKAKALGFAGLTELNAYVRKEISQGSPSPETLDLIKSFILDIETFTKSQAHEMGLKNINDDDLGLGSIGAAVDIEKMISQELATLEGLKQGLLAGDTSVLTTYEAIAKLREDRFAEEFQRVNPELWRFGQTSKEMPDVWPEIWLRSNENAALKLQSSMTSIVLGGTAANLTEDGQLPSGMTLPEVFQTVINAADGGTDEDKRAAAKDFLHQLGVMFETTDGEYPVEQKEKILKFLTQPGGAEALLQKIHPGARNKALELMFSDKAMETLAKQFKGTPTWNRLETFLRNSLYMSPEIQEALGEGAEGIKEIHKYPWMKVQIDPDTFSLQLIEAEPAEDPRAAQPRAGILERLNGRIKGLSDYMQILKPLQEQSGMTPEEYWKKKVIPILGTDPTQPDEPLTWSSIFGWEEMEDKSLAEQILQDRVATDVQDAVSGEAGAEGTEEAPASEVAPEPEPAAEPKTRSIGDQSSLQSEPTPEVDGTDLEAQQGVQGSGFAQGVLEQVRAADPVQAEELNELASDPVYVEEYGALTSDDAIKLASFDTTTALGTSENNATYVEDQAADEIQLSKATLEDGPDGKPLDANDMGRGGSVEKFIIKEAEALGMNGPKVVRALRTEGLGRGIWQSRVRNKKGIREPSYGPMQFLVGGPGTGYPRGLGNKFIEDTGLDPSDPKNLKEMIRYGLKVIKKEGWAQWYGPRKARMGRWYGVNG